jgi:hypothetical protein
MLMKTIILKIEKTYISLALVTESGGKRRILDMQRFPLPEDLSGDTDIIQPEYLTAIVIDVIKNSRMIATTVDVFFGSAVELFSEYRFSKSVADPVRKKREKQEEQALLADTGKTAYRLMHYHYDGEEGDLSASAVFAASADLCKKLVSGLEREGYIVRILSSSLIAFAELAKTVSDLGPRVLVIEAEKKEFKIALFTNGRLSRLSRFSGSIETASSAEVLVSFIKDETIILVCGFKTLKTRIRETLKKAGAAAIGSVNLKTEGLKNMFSLAGELAYQDKKFPRIFSAITVMDVKTEAASYLPGKQRKRNVNAPLIAICIVSFLVALFICAVPPLTLMSAEQEHALNQARFEDPFFANARIELSRYRLLVSEYTEILQTEESVSDRDLSYAGVIDELRKGLLLTANIDEMFYETEKGLFIDCVITEEDLETFDIGKNTLNRIGKVSVYEPSEREELDEGMWRLQLRVTRTPVPGEDTK